MYIGECDSISSSDSRYNDDILSIKVSCEDCTNSEWYEMTEDVSSFYSFSPTFKLQVFVT